MLVRWRSSLTASQPVRASARLQAFVGSWSALVHCSRPLSLSRYSSSLSPHHTRVPKRRQLGHSCSSKQRSTDGSRSHPPPASCAPDFPPRWSGRATVSVSGSPGPTSNPTIFGPALRDANGNPPRTWRPTRSGRCSLSKADSIRGTSSRPPAPSNRSRSAWRPARPWATNESICRARRAPYDSSTVATLRQSSGRRNPSRTDACRTQPPGEPRSSAPTAPVSQTTELRSGRGGEIRTPGLLLPKPKNGGIGVYRPVPACVGM